VLCIGLNYLRHAAESGIAAPDYPVLFMKMPSSVQRPGGPIVLPRALRSDEVDYECELAVVIGRRCRNVPREEALDYVLGYTCGNDVSERTIQLPEMKMGAMLIGKGFDTFCPIGPVIATGLDPSDLRIRTRLNGETRQDDRTSDLLFSVPKLVSYISDAMTLQPGDCILTGTPSGVGPIAPGDMVEIDIEGVGVLRNPVVAEG
jgi:2-keto-4-pentenoate hydratase/2-oxohepta-3-ene-1,7-dioic acid hydratase in catechol pathway